MRTVKYSDGMDIDRFVRYTEHYGCDDEDSISIMSVFFVYDQEAKKIFHTLRRRENKITADTKRAFVNVMKNYSVEWFRNWLNQITFIIIIFKYH